MHFGLGTTSASARVTGLDTTYSGTGISFGISAGAAIVHDLIVFGTVCFASTMGSTLSLNGYQSDTHLDLNLYGFGAGLAYYFPSLNIYVAGAISGISADLTPTDSSSTAMGMPLTKTGPGLELLVGKEWWVSDNWGLGLAGEMLQSWMTDTGDSSVRWHAASYNILFSATYN
jgi:hypothetical protein